MRSAASTVLTHRSFKTWPAIRYIFAVLDSMAIEGPAITWVADHRKHHQFSDREGDPHSPHVGHGMNRLTQHWLCLSLHVAAAVGTVRRSGHDFSNNSSEVV
jgi:fatty-acid desaturase